MLGDRYRGKLIIVTGALGMIGSNIVSALLAQGCRVVACDFASLSDRPGYLDASAIEGLLPPDRLCEWLDRNVDQVGAIVHMGAISDTTETNVALLAENNISFTLSLWQRAALHDWPFLYASSAATYGSGIHGFRDQDDLAYLELLNPLNAYGASKHTCDLQIVSSWRNGLAAPSVWAGFKFFNVYGPNEGHKGDMRSLVAKLIPVINAGGPIQLFRSHRPDFPDGGQLRDFVYVKDAIEPVLRALGQDRLSGLFNVGAGVARSFHDLSLATCDALGRSVNIEFIDMPDNIRRQYQYFTCADIGKSVSSGLHNCEHDLENGIADYVRVLKANRPEGLESA